MLLVGVFKGWEGAKSFLQPSQKSHVNVFVSLIRWEQNSITKIFLFLKKKLSPLEGDAGTSLLPTQILSVSILTISRETSRHHCHQCASVSLALLSIHAVMIMWKLLTLLTWENFLSPEIHPISRELEIQMGRNHTLCQYSRPYKSCSQSYWHQRWWWHASLPPSGLQSNNKGKSESEQKPSVHCLAGIASSKSTDLESVLELLCIVICGYAQVLFGYLSCLFICLGCTVKQVLSLGIFTYCFSRTSAFS